MFNSELYHVIPLCSKTSNMSIDVNCPFMLYPLQHSVNHNKCTCSTNTSTEKQEMPLENFDVLVFPQKDGHGT